MGISATKLRERLYEILDGVLETGEPVEINRKGRRLLIIAEKSPSRLENLEPHPGILPDPESIISPDWTGLWSGDTI
jgi:hypothetical protein